MKHRQIVDFAQEWLSKHVKPAPEMQGSFAAEMLKRASDEERVRHPPIVPPSSTT